MAFERTHVRGPEAPEGNEPFVELHERLWSQSINASLRVNARLNKSRLSQHPQVFGRRRLRQAQLALDVTHRALGREQQAEYGASVRLGDNCKGGFHLRHITQQVYYRQAM